MKKAIRGNLKLEVLKTDKRGKVKAMHLEEILAYRERRKW
jgi:hypothetical protein